jgi:hypothetical protein
MLLGAGFIVLSRPYPAVCQYLLNVVMLFFNVNKLDQTTWQWTSMIAQASLRRIPKN